MWILDFCIAMPATEEMHSIRPILREIEDCWSDVRTHSGWFNPPRRTTYKEQEQVKKDNFKRIQGPILGYELERCWSDMRTHPGRFNPPRRTIYKEQEQVKKANFKIIKVCGTHHSFFVLEKDQSNKVTGIFDVHFIKKESKTIDRHGTMEKYQIEAILQWGSEDCWSDMRTHPGRFNPPIRTTYKEQEQAKKANFKIIREAILQWGSEDCWSDMRTRSGLFGFPLSERNHRWEMEDCWSYMWTHPGRFNPPRRTIYKEQEQVKKANFKIIRGEVEAEMESRIEQDTFQFSISLLRDKMETIIEQARNLVTGIYYRFTDDGLWKKNNMTNTFQFSISLLRNKMETIIEQVRNMVAEINYRFTDDGLWEKNNMISFTDRETSVSLPESTVIYQDDVEWQNPPFLERIQRSERKRRSMDRLSYDGCSQSLVRPTYQEQEPEISSPKHGWMFIDEDGAEIESHTEQECKEKIVNVNSPEIQQPNHDVIDKEQQPGQDFIDVRKSRQTAKGVNMKLALILILVSVPVADCNHQDFKWLPTDKIVKEVFQKDAPLVWKYRSNLTLDKIDISRKKTEYGKEDVALWTPDVGSKPNTLLSTDVTLEHRKEGDVGTIILTLIEPYPVDFDKQYYCAVSFEHGVDSMEIELQSYKVEYQPVADVVKARPGDDAQFVWIYKYPLPVTFVDFYKNHDIQNEILTWSRSDGVYDIEDEYKNRATVNISTNNDQEEVTLTLRNVTRGDFDYTYHSLAIPANGYFKSSKITLRRLPVEEEKLKLVQETISPVQKTISTPSAASRLSQVSMFLICSVLLLAV